MRFRATIPLAMLVIGVCAAVPAGQAGGPMVRQAAPTDRAVDSPLTELEATFKEMDAKKLATIRLLEEEPTTSTSAVSSARNRR